MLASSRRRLALSAAALLMGVVAAGCSNTNERMRSALHAVTPYKVEVVQGNVVTKEQVDQLRAGMSRQQVRELLGTPLLADIFHANRWDYVFTIKRQGVEPQQRRLTVFFSGETLERFDGDTMPSEEEFVAGLDARQFSGKVPVLEATEDQLKKHEGKADAPVQGDASRSLAPLPPSYPPLESR
ncbi:outer membrane protein assembly factor BamE [Xenophilus arseniciresistens]|uniref:Outer membrane protein assembly factor BamE n=1 Tax=Xenophilus arseniciresistens TaxID=1283306 RepID=A0AAE3N947_9BURK|nr:outer membrane protein assembly factor BamE [Xenophilus arseniciresistens]MDA7418230.1 outer membrane protein assembly factor BamE [Xenophilus arseniciresistens]